MPPKSAPLPTPVLVTKKLGVPPVAGGDCMDSQLASVNTLAIINTDFIDVSMTTSCLNCAIFFFYTRAGTVHAR
jgi:hypothetical protein